jgi:hypothetical protein
LLYLYSKYFVLFSVTREDISTDQRLYPLSTPLYSVQKGMSYLGVSIWSRGLLRQVQDGPTEVQTVQVLILSSWWKSIWFMVFNATFNNISVISWWSVLLVEETRVPGENHLPAASHWQTLSHNVVSVDESSPFNLTVC